MLFFYLIRTIAPMLESWFGSDKDEALTFVRLNRSCSVLGEIFEIVVRVCPQNDVNWFIYVNKHHRSKPVHYVINTKLNGNCERMVYVSWAKQHFRIFFDGTNIVLRDPVVKRARPVPKPKAASKPKTMTLFLYGLHRITEIVVPETATTENLKDEIALVLGVQPCLQQLHHHASTQLVEIFDGLRLSDFNITHGDHITLLKIDTAPSDSEDNFEVVRKPSQFDITADQEKMRRLQKELQRLIDARQLEDLREQWKADMEACSKAREKLLVCVKGVQQFDKAKFEYRSARDRSLATMKAVKQLEQQIVGSGASSSSSRR
jgi:hypothetical protein